MPASTEQNPIHHPQGTNNHNGGSEESAGMRAIREALTCTPPDWDALETSLHDGSRANRLERLNAGNIAGLLAERHVHSVIRGLHESGVQDPMRLQVVPEPIPHDTRTGRLQFAYTMWGGMCIAKRPLRDLARQDVLVAEIDAHVLCMQGIEPDSCVIIEVKVGGDTEGVSGLKKQLNYVQPLFGGIPVELLVAFAQDNYSIHSRDNDTSNGISSGTSPGIYRGYYAIRSADLHWHGERIYRDIQQKRILMRMC